MIKALQFLLVCFTLVATNSCNQEEVSEQIILPSNLEVLVEELENGQVRVIFSAQKANFFRVGFGDSNELPAIVTGNEVMHRYTSPGKYTIVVQAHATEGSFIKKDQTVTISEQMLGIGFPESGFVSPLQYAGYTMSWNDEFNSNSLSSDWVFETGDGCPNICGWGNNELQFYRRENTEVKEGYLVITAKRENVGGKNFTSSRIKTQGKQVFKFGRIDIRAALPKGQGIWPAFWMLGENITDVSWPACGEIDIMEMIGGNQAGRDNTVHGTIHWDQNGAHRYQGGKRSLTGGSILADNFHVYSIIWDENKITWLLDNEVYHEEDIRSSEMNEFRAPFFLLINLAVGGNWPGNPDDSTVFPQQMAVDYVRVFKKN